MIHYATRDEAILDVSVRHGVNPEELDLIPGEDVMYVSYGPANEDVEACSWDEEPDELFSESCDRLSETVTPAR